MSKRQPDRLDAWILGSGIASLTAAVHLIQEARVPPSRIHIIETLSVPGGTTQSYGDAEHGYDFRAGERPQLDDKCVDALLSLVPSMSDPSRTVRDEIIEFAESLDIQQTHTRFLARNANGVCTGDGKIRALGLRDRVALFMLASKSEMTLGRASVRDFLSDSFFSSGYWLWLATTFGMNPSHSAAELRRYLHRFNNLHDFSHSNMLELGKYNVHESTIVPAIHFLKSRGVDFRLNTTICDILFAHDNPNNRTEPTRVTAILTTPARTCGTSISSKDEVLIHLSPDDIVFVSIGSVFSSTLTGTNTNPPPSIPIDLTNNNADTGPSSYLLDSELDENWLLWLELCTKHPKFGNAYNFCTRLQSSRIVSFTITLSSPEFLSRLSETTAQSAGPNTILIIRDSPWVITLRIPPQPVFPSQPAHIQVCWGYALAPEKSGAYVPKPMIHCSGEEILSEILSLLRYPLEPIISNAITIPCIKPRCVATLLPRTPHDRPKVIPDGMTNMAVIGPFVEIPDEAVITTDYTVRGAQIAVRELLGIRKAVGKSKKGMTMGFWC